MSPAELLMAAHKEVLDSYRREFEQLAATFRDVDGKAQGTAVIAGGFLAAALAFVGRQGVLDSGLSRVLAALAVLGLMAAIGFSVASLRVRAIASPPSGADMTQLLKDLSTADPQELAERMPHFYSDAAELWRECLVRRRLVNQAKAATVWSAQRSLIASAACVAILILLFLVSDRKVTP
jgi:hypothetical protein